MFRLLKLAAYFLLGYAAYQFYLGLTQGQQGKPQQPNAGGAAVRAMKPVRETILVRKAVPVRRAIRLPPATAVPAVSVPRKRKGPT